MIPLLGGALHLAANTLSMVGLATAAGMGYAFGKRAGSAICNFSDRVENAVMDAIRD
tara:strand:- start:1691 stop:1861 length:171 start_codon:yes stop_codon:yes gene_type:complete